MKGLKGFLKATFIGGVIVILPLVILYFVVDWLFGAVVNAIEPITDLLTDTYGLHVILANLLVVAVFIGLCFLIGSIVRTALGAGIYRIFERRLLRRIPGYYLIKETVVAFLGTENPPFSSVALVQVFGSDTLMSAFITDTHADGSYTVFVPTGPNPMSGNIYHLQEKYVHIVDVPVDHAVRTIISCGANSTRLIEAYNSGESDLRS
jgi:uncharacterized membrane protein